jgi:hypothetical protein
VAFSIALVSGASVGQQPLPQDTTEIRSLMTRVVTPSQLALDEFRKAGMEGVKPHTLTASEQDKVKAALLALPALHRYVLDKRLNSFAFVDGIPGEGTGLTSPAVTKGLYDITFRASLLDETLSTFLTNKERRVFSADGSGVTLTVRGTGTDALTYVLLHEATHVVDKSCGITATRGNPFTASIWTGPRTLVPSLASSVAATTYFRGGRPLPLTQAANVYNALSQTPFLSLYSTAAREEDFAELVAWHELFLHHHGNLVIELKDTRGEPPMQWKPLNFEGVQRRFLEVDKLFLSANSCGPSSESNADSSIGFEEHPLPSGKVLDGQPTYHQLSPAVALRSRIAGISDAAQGAQ